MKDQQQTKNKITRFKIEQNQLQPIQDKELLFGIKTKTTNTQRQDLTCYICQLAISHLLTKTACKKFILWNMFFTAENAFVRPTKELMVSLQNSLAGFGEWQEKDKEENEIKGLRGCTPTSLLYMKTCIKAC